ncbi:hypothetical protein ABZ896_11630 [Streptomyces sp. NPDC047072]|uniref:hypothetical protein n=1 Tax=Streptomyces sp. NPDC047072 TaxID=3154809 RepID=UPI0033C798DA
MMQHARAPVQNTDVQPHPARGQPRISTDNPFILVRGHAEQDIDTTASRRTRRGDFLRAATWAITERLHPKAQDTTLRVAKDLAARLNADGHVAYCRDAMWRRLGLSRRTLERHIAVLRELGLLAWVVHGSRTNTRPAGSGDWAGTATIYAAVVPRAWDHALGHRVSGHGYHARHIGFTDRGRELAIADARRRARPANRRDTPSWRTNHPRRTAEMGRKNNNTGAPPPRTRRGTARTHRPDVPAPYRATPQQAAHAVSVAAWIRPRVPWTQAEPLRRLAYALRPWIAAGQAPAEIAAELMAWRVPRRPASPAAVITVRWHEETRQPSVGYETPGPAEEVASVPPNQAFRTAAAALRTRLRPQHPPSEPELPAFVIRDRILASLAEAQRAWRARAPEQCHTFAQWEAVCDARERVPW